jgi:hypothetical protein
MEPYVDAGGLTKCDPVEIEHYAIYMFRCLLLTGDWTTANGFEIVLRSIRGQVQKMASLDESANVGEMIERRGIKRISLLNISC